MTTDLDAVIEKTHEAVTRTLSGQADVYRGVLSVQDDVTFGNSFGVFVSGQDEVSDKLAETGARYRNVEILGFQPVARYVADDLACLVEVELYRARVDGTEFAVIGQRVTNVFRLEDGGWRLVHRHADIPSPFRSTAAGTGP